LVFCNVIWTYENIFLFIKNYIYHVFINYLCFSCIFFIKTLSAIAAL
jgi:hypothetical protein